MWLLAWLINIQIEGKRLTIVYYMKELITMVKSFILQAIYNQLQYNHKPTIKISKPWRAAMAQQENARKE
jgi:hypothetical protein